MYSWASSLKLSGSLRCLGNDHLPQAFDPQHDECDVRFGHPRRCQHIFEHIGNLVEVHAVDMVLGMCSVHISAGIELCGFTHDKRHIFHRVLGQVLHINALKVSRQLMTRHDFMVKSFDNFGNGGNAAVFVKQGIELWGLGGAGAGSTATASGVLAFLAKAEPRLSWKSREPHFEHFDGFASSEATPHLLQTLMAI